MAVLSLIAIGLAAFFNNENCAQFLAGDGIVSDPWEFLIIMRYRLLLVFMGVLLAGTAVFYDQTTAIFKDFNYRAYGLVTITISTAIVGLGLIPFANIYITQALSVGDEFNVPTFWSTFLYLFVVLFIWHFLSYVEPDKKLTWTMILLLALFLGADELFQVHEKIGILTTSLISRFINPDFSITIEAHTWILVYVPIATILGFAVLKTLYADLIGSKQSLLIMLLGIFIFLLGAVGLEIVEFIETENDIVIIPFRIVMEEYFEMIGLSVFGMGLARFMKTISLD